MYVPSQLRAVEVSDRWQQRCTMDTLVGPQTYRTYEDD